MEADITYLNGRTEMYANKARSQEPSFRKGDKVYLVRKNIKTKQPNSKLDYKKLGPYEIKDKKGLVMYKLQLPIRSRVHLVFYILLLKPALENVEVSNELVEPMNEPDVYNIERILRTRTSANS